MPGLALHIPSGPLMAAQRLSSHDAREDGGYQCVPATPWVSGTRDHDPTPTPPSRTRSRRTHQTWQQSGNHQDPKLRPVNGRS